MDYNQTTYKNHKPLYATITLSRNGITHIFKRLIDGRSIAKITDDDIKHINPNNDPIDDNFNCEVRIQYNYETR